MTTQLAPYEQIRPRRSFRFWFWRCAQIWTVLSLVVCVIAFIGASSSPPQSPANLFWNQVTFCAILPVGLFWIVAWFFPFLFAFHENVKVAVKPIPSLQEIEQQIVLAGYTPTLQEVLLVEQRLKSERNTAVAVSAGLIVATYAGARIAKGESIIP
jgi:hypothetical protein